MNKETKTLNNSPEGRVCPTHDCFSLWQEVWMMHYNVPTKVRIVSVEIKGFNRPVFGILGKNREIKVVYKVTDTLHYYDESSGFNVAAERLFPSKQALLESFMDNTEKDK